MQRSPATVLSGFVGAGKTTLLDHALADVDVATQAGESKTAASSVRLVDGIADLTEIFDPAVNVVLLRRALSPALVEEGRRALGEPGFRRLFAVSSDTCGLRSICEELVGLPHLIADLQLWAEVLAALTDSARIGVRLARVEAAMCPRFHVDRVTLRLVSTYEGRGTEYVSSGQVDRRRLGHAAAGAADEASGLLLSADCVHAAEPGEVVLLKGEAWPDNAGRGAVHRSPAASAASPRLVMTLDPL